MCRNNPYTNGQQQTPFFQPKQLSMVLANWLNGLGYSNSLKHHLLYNFTMTKIIITMYFNQFLFCLINIQQMHTTTIFWTEIDNFSRLCASHINSPKLYTICCWLTCSEIEDLLQPHSQHQLHHLQFSNFALIHMNYMRVSTMHQYLCQGSSTP